MPIYLADVIQGVGADDHGRHAAVRGLSAARGAPCLTSSSTLFEVGFFAALIRIATPLILATLGELINERSGVLNLGIEGIMLLGAMVGFTTAYFTGNLWLGVARGDPRSARSPGWSWRSSPSCSASASTSPASA